MPPTVTVLPSPETIATVDAALTSRRSVRAFLPTPAPRQTVEDKLGDASRSPSDTHTQPWNVYVLSGASQARLTRRIADVYDAPQAAVAHSEEYPCYPAPWVTPYVDRRRKIGWDRYGLLGIAKRDRDRMHARLCHADSTASVNALITKRSPVAEFARFLD